jgi:hypothetical protein
VLIPGWLDVGKVGLLILLSRSRDKMDGGDFIGDYQLILLGLYLIVLLPCCRESIYPSSDSSVRRGLMYRYELIMRSLSTP